MSKAYAAEQVGECQVCGRHQKIRKSGEIASHGYQANSLSGGGNSGSCPGSYALPAPATGAVERTIERQQAALVRAEARLAEYQAPGYVWPERVSPVRALRSVREEITNIGRSIERLTARRAELLARVSA
jgi:hypothetical protein